MGFADADARFARQAGKLLQLSPGLSDKLSKPSSVAGARARIGSLFQPRAARSLALTELAVDRARGDAEQLRGE